MLTYKISIDKKAQKFILKQPKNKQELIYKAIYNLPNGDTSPLKGHKGLNRLRVGDYRISADIKSCKVLGRAMQDFLIEARSGRAERIEQYFPKPIDSST